MNVNLLILTTATNRADLHKHVFLGYKRFLTPKNKNNNINKVWVINIDKIDEFSTTVGFVKYRIKKIFDNRQIDFRWLIRDEGNFYRAVRTLIKQGVKILNNGNNMKAKWFILYLEDDWWYHDRSKHIDYFIEKMITEQLDYLELRTCPTQDRKYTYFAPSLWSYVHFKKVSKTFLGYGPNRKTDPEQICKPVFWKRGGWVNVFVDIGREWLLNHGLVKNNNKKLRGCRDGMYTK